MLCEFQPYILMSIFRFFWQIVSLSPAIISATFNASFQSLSFLQYCRGIRFCKNRFYEISDYVFGRTLSDFRVKYFRFLVDSNHFSKSNWYNSSKIGGVYSAGGQLVVQEKQLNSGYRKKKNGFFGEARYVVSKGQPVRGPAQRRQAEIRTRSRSSLDWNPDDSTEDREDLILGNADRKSSCSSNKGTLNGPAIHWKARRRAQLIPRAKLRTPLPNYQKLQVSLSTSENPDEEYEVRPRRNNEKRKRITSPGFRTEPQMIRVRDSISTSSHLHSEKIRISRDSAIFEIKSETPTDGPKFSSKYEIYNSTKPFGKSYRELTISSSNSCTSTESRSSSSTLSETTTYITCSSEFEPVQMTGFQCIGETDRQTNGENGENLQDPKDYDEEIVNGDRTWNDVEIKPQPTEPESKSEFVKWNEPNSNNLIRIESWKGTQEKPLKSPILLKQMISSFDNGLLYELPKSSTKHTFQEEHYTYEPESKSSKNNVVTRCRSLLNLELEQPELQPQPMCKTTSELNIVAPSEKERIKKTISVMLEKRRKMPEPEAPSPGPELLVNDNVAEPVCRVTGELFKNQRTTGTFAVRNTLPRPAKSHRSELQRHFYYPRLRHAIRDEELPDPDTVRQARELFERVLKLRAQADLQVPHKPERCSYNTIGSRPTHEVRIPQSPRLRKCLSVDTKWSPDGSLSSGVGSYIGHDTDPELSPRTSDGVSECGSKEDTIFSSDEETNLAKDDQLGKPISSDIMKNIRAYGTSITYYGGKIIESSKGHSVSPMTMTIMNEIRQCTSPELKANRKCLFDDKQFVKYKLVKSNSCGSRLEFTGMEDCLHEHESNKRDTETIKEEEEDEHLKKDECRGEKQNGVCNGVRNKLNNHIRNHRHKTYPDMEFEEFEVVDT